MSRRILWSLGLTMGIVMTGLIIVQTYWIKNAMFIKEQQFNQLVGRSITDVTREIERKEAASRLMDEFNPFIWHNIFPGQNFNFRPDVSSIIDSNKIADPDQGVSLNNGSFEDSYTTFLRQDSIIFYHNDSVNSRKAIHINELNKENRVIAETFIKQFYSRQGFFNDIVSKMMNPHVPIERRINAESLKNLLEHEFRQHEINLGFEYAIIRETGEVVFHSHGYGPKKDTDIFSAQLFPEDIFSLPNYLMVYFPGKKHYVLRSVGFMGLSSVSLTLIIIALFIITLFVIFKQKRLSEIKSDFVNNMTHELKTPISTISLASQMLNDDTIPEENKNILNISRIIDTESKRLGYQVEKVLQMAIFDKGKIKLKVKEVDMHELISSVCSNFEIQLQKTGGTLGCKLNASKTIVKVDELHFNNLISNLIDNAVKYCKEQPDIKVETRNDKNYLVIMVEDKGVGISREDQKRIFEKFYRVSTGNIHNVKGFGLGLSYVKKIAEIHEGFVKLKSELHKGARFEVFVPLYNEN